MANLLADVQSFAGAATPNDDLTLVMVRYAADGQRMAAGSARGL